MDKPTIEIGVASESDQPVLAVLRASAGTYEEWFWVGVRRVVIVDGYPVEQGSPHLVVVALPACGVVSQQPPTGLPVGGTSLRTGAVIDEKFTVFSVVYGDLPKWPTGPAQAIDAPCPGLFSAGPQG